jgi:hypothetical protein
MYDTYKNILFKKIILVENLIVYIFELLDVYL